MAKDKPVEGVTDLPALPGGADFVDSVGSTSTVKQKRGLVVAYADLIYRCVEAGDRNLELKVIRSLERMVLGDVKSTGQAKEIAAELEETGQRIWSMRHVDKPDDGPARH